MENASKALIIAGSILLSILIIALGMYIFSTSSSTSDVSVLSETEVQTFNAKFEKYNKEQIGSNVEALIRALRSNATANKGSAEKIPTVYFYDSGNTNDDFTESADDFTASSGDLTTPASEGGTSPLEDYTDALTDMADAVERSHRYIVAMEYDTNGLINEIQIRYQAAE